MNHEEIVASTKRWISSMVIGLNLCPFAQRVFDAGTIRYVICETTDESILTNFLAEELKFLAAVSPTVVETTLLIHPNIFRDFLDYNDYLEVADDLLVRLDLDGVIQIASFHPEYQFADTAADAVENYTNRSPYPMLHLLREESVSAVAEDEEKLLAIPERNIATLRALGIARVSKMVEEIRLTPGSKVD